MSTLYLSQLTLQAFGPFAEPLVVSLPQSGMHLVRGKNENTGGSSGSGKSKLIEALAFALGYATFAATDLRSWSWLTKDPMKVVLSLKTKNGDLRVSRGAQASVQWSDGKVHTSAKAVAEVLRQATGLSPEMLKALTYRPQREPGMFLAMTDSEKKSFLTELLGLGVYEELAEGSVARISELERQIGQLQAVADAAVSAMPEKPTPPNLDELTRQASEADGKVLHAAAEASALKAKYNEVVSARASCAVEVERSWKPKTKTAFDAIGEVKRSDTAALSNEVATINQTVDSLRSAHRTLISIKRRALEEAIAKVRHLKEVAGTMESATTAGIQAQADLNMLLSKLCFTCNRPWDVPQDGEAVKNARRRFDEADKAIKAAANATALMGSAHETAVAISEQVTTLEAADPVDPALLTKKDKLRAAIVTVDAEYQRRLAEARENFQHVSRDAEGAENEADKITDEESNLYTAYNKVVVAQGAWTAERNRVRGAIGIEQARYDVLATDYGTAEARAKKAATDLVTTEGKLNHEKDFLGYVRGFLAFIFDETLARVAALTNERLISIPNVSSLTIRFDSERETGSGKMRQEIRPVVEKDGNVIPLRAGVSGGMYTAVELAVDLSLADVISERTGVVPGWLILDECFEGLDPICKAACFDLLKIASANRAILVVDHTTEFVEKFDASLTVRYSGERSTVL